MEIDETDIIRRTIDFWSDRYGEELSSDDAREIIRNVSGVFQLLREWEKKPS
jgi:HEPN domain-containing protein